MKSLTHLLPLGLAACLAGAAGTELLAPEPAPAPSYAFHFAASSAPPPLRLDAGLSSRRTTILARPLFRPDRRPPPPSAHSGDEAPMPRLSGILIGTGQRLALFAGPGGKTRAASTGEQIGVYRILHISPSAVILAENHRRLVLQPRFDKDAAPGAAAPGMAQPSPLSGFVPERR